VKASTTNRSSLDFLHDADVRESARQPRWDELKAGSPPDVAGARDVSSACGTVPALARSSAAATIAAPRRAAAESGKHAAAARSRSIASAIRGSIAVSYDGSVAKGFIEQDNFLPR